MMAWKSFVFLWAILQYVASTEPPCVIEVGCRECVPDNMPLVTSHRAVAGSVTAASGDELALSCGAGRLLAYPLRASLAVRCEAGRYRVLADGSLRHLLELGCQEEVLEDVLHEVEHCAPPLQGRAYQVQASGDSTVHLATVCYDEDRGIATFAHVTNAPALRLPPHSDARAPLTLFGNLNAMFDTRTRATADRLLSDDVRMNRRLAEMFKHDKFSFAEQALTSASLLSAAYFDDQHVRVADFVTNRMAVWRSVAAGNLAHLQRDVAKLLRMSRPHGAVEVFAGTHGTAALRAGAGGERRAAALGGGGRVPLPRYVWAVVADRRRRRALALVVLNEPHVAVSEVREAVFCESVCGQVAWLHELRRHRNYESPVYGLAFCCSVHELAAVVEELPRAPLADIPHGRDGLLLDVDTSSPPAN